MTKKEIYEELISLGIPENIAKPLSEIEYMKVAAVKSLQAE